MNLCVTYPDDVSVATKAITPKTRGAFADPLTSPHCLAGGLVGMGDRETWPSIQYSEGKLDTTSLPLSVPHPPPFFCTGD